MCVPFNFDKPEIIFNDLGLMSYAEILSRSLDLTEHRKGALEHLRSINKVEKNYMVKTITLDALLKKIKAPKIINFFSLDVEGSEIQVLKGFNFNEYIIEYLLIESRDLNQITNFLNKFSYKLIKEFKEFETTQQKNLLFQHSSVSK